MSSIQLGSKIINNCNDEVYIIAEIGQNHQGDIEIAKEMILQAKKAGCDCVKFQKSCLPAKFTRSALEKPYINKNSWGATYGEHKGFLEFSEHQFKELQAFSNTIGIDFTASAMDKYSLSFLDSLNVSFIKIGSGDANNFPMLEDASKLSKPLVISTGMQTMDSIEKIVQIMNNAKKSNYALLHCVSSYPTEDSDCNISVISLLKSKFPDIIIGYSGHELGVDISKAAVLYGARIIERHFTLDKSQKGSDHSSSLSPEEMFELIQGIDNLRVRGLLKENHLDWKEVNDLVNTSGKSNLKEALKPVENRTVMLCELPCKRKLGKSIVAAKDLNIGESLSKENIEIKVSEPPGIPAEYYYNVVGQKLIQNVEQDNPISYAHIKNI